MPPTCICLPRVGNQGNLMIAFGHVRGESSVPPDRALILPVHEDLRSRSCRLNRKTSVLRGDGFPLQPEIDFLLDVATDDGSHAAGNIPRPLGADLVFYRGQGNAQGAAVAPILLDAVNVDA